MRLLYSCLPSGELMCVVGIVRHGDRTPKQKLKFHTAEPELLSLINEYLPAGEDELKLKNVRPAAARPFTPSCAIIR